MDKTVTNAVVGSVATSAATGAAKAATTSGAAIVNSASGSSAPGQGKVVAVGAFAQSPSQLVTAGIIKPGSDVLINGLAQTGANVSQIMPKSLFTGMPGATDLDNYIQDTSAQTTAMVTNMQKAQTALGKVGMITGKEAPNQLAGMVMAGATVGLGPTVDAVKEISGASANAASGTTNVPGAITNSVSGAQGSTASGAAPQSPDTSGQAAQSGQTPPTSGQATNALKAIGAGGAAAGLAQSLGGMGGISNAVKGLSKGLGGLGKSIGGMFGGAGGGDGPSFTDLVESVKGPAGAAFSAIRDSLKPLQVGVPQNLSAIAKSTAATAAGIASSASGITGEGSEAIKSLLSVPDSVTSVTDLTGLVENNSIAGISGAFNQVKSQFGVINTEASGEATKLINQIGAAATASTTSGITNQLSTAFGGNATATLTNLTKSFTSVPKLIDGIPDNLGSITDPMNVVNNVFTNINTSATGVNSTLPLTPTNTATAINNIGTAVKDVTGMIGAGPALSSGNMKELANAAAAIQDGASAAKAAAVASGVSNLPGGLKSLGAVMNNLDGASNMLPGTEALGGLMKNVQTTALNGLSDPKGLTDSVKSTLGGVLGKEGGLTNLISSALPLGGATSLLSSLSALGAGGPAKIKMPTLGFNTFDRAGLTNQIKNMLGNPKIPMPNLIGEIQDGLASQLDQLTKQSKDAFKVFDDLENWDQRIKDAQDKLYEAEANLPAGDKGIEAARGALDSIFNNPEYKSLMKKAADLGEVDSNDVTAMMTNASQTATNMMGAAKLGSLVTNVKSSALDTFRQATKTSPTAVKSVTGQGSTSITMMQAKASSTSTDINNSLAGIVGPSTGATFT